MGSGGGIGFEMGFFGKVGAEKRRRLQGRQERAFLFQRDIEGGFLSGSSLQEIACRLPFDSVDERLDRGEERGKASLRISLFDYFTQGKKALGKEKGKKLFDVSFS